MLSGSWPGEIYWFRRQNDGTFAAPVTLKHGDGKEVNVGSAASAFAVDWDADDDFDLVIGTILGEVHVVPNEGDCTQPVFGEAQQPTVAGEPLTIAGGDAAPVAADWDGDGKPDLLIGADDGGVCWYRNVGERGKPQFAEAKPLLPESPVGWNGDESRGKCDWGLRVKLCVTDWNGDGRMDLLLGDRCGSFRGKPPQTDRERAEEDASADILPELRRKWAETFREYRQLTVAASDAEESTDRLAAVRERLLRYKNEIAAAQEILERYEPGYQSHGFVWLFLRKEHME